MKIILLIKEQFLLRKEQIRNSLSNTAFIRKRLSDKMIKCWKTSSNDISTKARLVNFDNINIVKKFLSDVGGIQS